MIRLEKLIENKWLREFILFTLLLTITIINDREGFISPHKLRDGFFIFVMLYAHVQVQRFLILPFLISKRYFLYGLLAITVVLLFSLAADFIDLIMTDVGWYDDFDENNIELFTYYFLSFLATLPLLLLVFFVISYYRQQKTENEHQILLKDMELRLLRTQLNPHFLFNNLNNLYGISLEKPEQVSDKIMQMSQIMRYQLELSKEKYVSLKDDLDFIGRYIDLESDRFAEDHIVSFKQETHSADLSAFRIAPLILISFVENAFKHYSPEKGGGGFIKIDIEFLHQKLILKISNSFDDRMPNPASMGFGLINTKKRLDLLYPDRYQLTYGTHGGHYELFFELICEERDQLV